MERYERVIRHPIMTREAITAFNTALDQLPEASRVWWFQDEDRPRGAPWLLDNHLNWHDTPQGGEFWANLVASMRDFDNAAGRLADAIPDPDEPPAPFPPPPRPGAVGRRRGPNLEELVVGPQPGVGLKLKKKVVAKDDIECEEL